MRRPHVTQPNFWPHIAPNQFSKSGPFPGTSTPQGGKLTITNTLRNTQNFSYEVSHLRVHAIPVAFYKVTPVIDDAKGQLSVTAFEMDQTSVMPPLPRLDEKAEEAAAPLSVSVNSMPYE